jgi:hypothetical protein
MVEVVINQNDGFVSITAVGGETELDFDFPIYEKAHLRIIRTRAGVDTTLVLDTDYTIATDQLEVTAGGTAVLLVAATAADVYSLLLNAPEARTTDFNQAGDLFASTLNRELDLEMQAIQGLRRDVDKSARLPESSTLTSLTLAAPEASKIIGWNSTATGLANYASTDLSGTTVSAFIETLFDDTTAAEARTTLGALSSANGAVATANLADGAVTQDKLAVAVRKLLASNQDFRLTLTSGAPVTTSDVTGATTIYCTPYKGNCIALYDGTNWNLRTSAEFSLALGTLTSGRPYDVFCYDNAGTPTLEFTSWTNDTTRATALVYQDGVLVKSGATTRRYMGTFFTTSTTATSDAEAGRYLWNYYHRVLRSMKAAESTDSWNYSTITLRQANGSTANQLNFVLGVSEDAVDARVQAEVLNSTATLRTCYVGIGLDSTTVSSAIGAQRAQPGNTAFVPLNAIYRGVPAAGRHYLAWLEIGGGTDTQTWYGDAGVGSSLEQNGIFGTVWS